MQDCLALRAEVPELRALGVCRSVEVVPSRDVWNPLAAVLLRDFALPPSISPASIDLRIPVPDLYGLASTVSVVLFDRPLIEAGRKGKVPFCEPVDAEALATHGPYLPDFRGHRADIEGLHYLCLTPLWSPGGGYHHVTLAQFVQYLLHYLEAPSASLERDVQLCQEEWIASGEAWWLLRLAHIYEGLGRFEQAADACVKGQQAFPGRTDFRRLLDRIERKASGRNG